MDFLLLYEHKVRELENACLLKIELESRGYSVMLKNIYDTIDLGIIFKDKPSVIITPWMYRNRTIRFLHSKFGFVPKIISLQYEQVLSKKWERIGFHVPKDKAQKAVHLCWGEACKERLLSKGINKNNIRITGSIQMDWLRPEFKDYYLSKKDISKYVNIDPTKQWVLYISSFTLANASAKKISNMEKSVNANMNDMQIAMKKSKKATLRWIEKLIIEKPELVFIYRPHPNESEDVELKLLEERHENFKVISSYSVKQWINVCDVLFTWISTSIAEAYFANKNCQILRPINLDPEIEMSIFEGGEFIESYEQLLEYMESRNNLTYKNRFPIDERLLEQNYFYDLKSDSSYINICNVCEEILKQNDKKYNLDNMTSYILRLQYIILKLFKDTCNKSTLVRGITRKLLKEDSKLFRLILMNNDEIEGLDDIKLIEKRILKLIK